MTGRYQAYQGYKPSGSNWLGQIPDHWSVFSGKRLFRNVRRPSLASDEQLAASQKYGVVPQSMMMELNDSKVMLALKGTESFRHVDKNNFVISLRSFEGGIEHSDYEGCVSPAYTVLEPSKPIFPKYYKYLLKCGPYISALQSSTDSLRDGKSITFEQFSAIALACPEYTEQQSIANFLDHETAKIDTLIDKQQQLIKLLIEKRQAVISHAVTKGLNPDAPMKDSGVEWLGVVPEHWVVGSLRWYISISSGEYLSNQEFDLSSIDLKQVPVIGGNGIMGYTKQPNQDKALVIGRVGALCGNVHLFTEPVWVTDNALCVDYSKKLSPEYLALYLRVINLNRLANQNTQPLITGTMVKDQPVLIPSFEEQYAIVSEVERRLFTFDDLNDKAVKAIELMQERRTALISAAVTGKIDVRNWQPAQTKIPMEASP